MKKYAIMMMSKTHSRKTTFEIKAEENILNVKKKFPQNLKIYA